MSIYDNSIILDVDFLNERDIALLSDRLWRRMVELFILACNTGNKGELPPMTHIAWRLRVPQQDIEKDIDYFIKAGILVEIDNGYRIESFYYNWENRQWLIGA